MITRSPFFFLLLMFSFQGLKAQSPADSSGLVKEYRSIEEALRNPEKVYRLNLSDQNIQLSDSIWSKFTNLQYLSLRNDRLKTVPDGITNLKNLKVLDLSGNDFKMLPATFGGLANLQELYLNDDKNFRFEENIPILSELPNLKSLHLSNDGLRKLPKNIFLLSKLEFLYLSNNQFKEVPLEINGLKSLQYVDLQDNKIRTPQQFKPESDFGVKIRF